MRAPVTGVMGLVVGCRTRAERSRIASVGDYNTIKSAFFYLFFAQKHRLFAQKSPRRAFPARKTSQGRPGDGPGKTVFFLFMGKK